MSHWSAPSTPERFDPDPDTSPFRERFDIERFRDLWAASGKLTPEHAHRFAHDLYEIDESYERMFYALRRGVIPRMEVGDVKGALDAVVEYSVWLEHLTWHAETFLKAFEAWMTAPEGGAEQKGVG